MKRLIAFSLLAAAFVVQAKEVGALSVNGQSGKFAIVLFDEQRSCPTGTTAVVYIDHKVVVEGCWFEWLGKVRLTFEDNDSGTILRSAFKARGA